MSTACSTSCHASPPPPPGGYTVGETVYFVGKNWTAENGDRVVYGEQCVVMAQKPGDSHRLVIKFLNNNGKIICRISDELSRSPPPRLPAVTRCTRRCITSE